MENKKYRIFFISGGRTDTEGFDSVDEAAEWWFNYINKSHTDANIVDENNKVVQSLSGSWNGYKNSILLRVRKSSYDGYWGTVVVSGFIRFTETYEVPLFWFDPTLMSFAHWEKLLARVADWEGVEVITTKKFDKQYTKWKEDQRCKETA